MIADQQPEKPPISAPPPVATGFQCLNCGHAVEHEYCPKCGQHIRDHNHGIWQFVKEFLDDFIRLDSKFIRTLVPLCFKPGFLTHEWVIGKRVRYITPLKLYISLSALCFLALQFKSTPNIVHANVSPSKPTSGLNVKTSVAKPSISGPTINVGDRVAENVSNRLAGVPGIDEETPAATDGAPKTPDSSASKKPKAKKPKSDSSNGPLVKSAWLDQFVNDSLKDLTKNDPRGDALRKEYTDRFMSRLPTFNLVLLPIFALIFKLLYARRSKFYVEHLVFALHYYAFACLGVTIMLVVPWDLVKIPVGIWLAVYMPLAMFFNYRQGVIKTFVKWTIFNCIYFIAAAMMLAGLAIYTAYDQSQNSVLASSKDTAQSQPDSTKGR